MSYFPISQAPYEEGLILEEVIIEEELELSKPSKEFMKLFEFPPEIIQTISFEGIPHAPLSLIGRMCCLSKEGKRIGDTLKEKFIDESTKKHQKMFSPSQSITLKEVEAYFADENALYLLRDLNVLSKLRNNLRKELNFFVERTDESHLQLAMKVDRLELMRCKHEGTNRYFNNGVPTLEFDSFVTDSLKANYDNRFFEEATPDRYALALHRISTVPESIESTYDNITKGRLTFMNALPDWLAGLDNWMLEDGIDLAARLSVKQESAAIAVEICKTLSTHKRFGVLLTFMDKLFKYDVSMYFKGEFLKKLSSNSELYSYIVQNTEGVKVSKLTPEISDLADIINKSSQQVFKTEIVDLENVKLESRWQTCVRTLDRSQWCIPLLALGTVLVFVATVVILTLTRARKVAED